MTDVTDLFDSFHRLARTLWVEFGSGFAEAEEDEEGISYDDLVDQLEMDVFLPACARRLKQRTARQLDPDDVASMIRVCSADGPLSGPSGRYHSHAFHPESVEGDVPRAILTADLMARELGDLRLQLAGEDAQAGRTRRRGQLPTQ